MSHLENQSVKLQKYTSGEVVFDGPMTVIVISSSTVIMAGASPKPGDPTHYDIYGFVHFGDNDINVTKKIFYDGGMMSPMMDTEFFARHQESWIGKVCQECGKKKPYTWQKGRGKTRYEEKCKDCHYAK